jgi:hypothetical protein
MTHRRLLLLTGFVREAGGCSGALVRVDFSRCQEFGAIKLNVVIKQQIRLMIGFVSDNNSFV